MSREMRLFLPVFVGIGAGLQQLLGWKRDTAEVAGQEKPFKQKANGCAEEVDQEKAQKVKSRRGRD